MAQEHQVSFVPLTRRLVTFTHFRALSLIDFCAQGGAVHVAATTFGSVTHVEHFKQAVRVRAVAIGAPTGGHASRAIVMGLIARAKVEQVSVSTDNLTTLPRCHPTLPLGTMDRPIDQR